MRTAGIREARQNLTSLLDDVRKGRQVVISDRGRPVAMLVPVRAQEGFPDLKPVRRRMQAARARLSQAVVDDRDDRL
ncbi:MAG: type II toxin-antitoxin system prevent-host-death family antitoxin [Vicinamibacteraceae bacterium]